MDRRQVAKWTVLGGALLGAVGLLVYALKTGALAATKPAMTVRPGLPSSPRRRGRPTSVVVHHTATQDADATYRTLVARGYGTHFEVDHDGRIWQYVHPDLQTDHASGWNERAIGIDLTGPGFTSAQIAAFSRLARWLSTEYDIPRVFAPWGCKPAGVEALTWRGFVAHANTDCQKPDPSYTASISDGRLWAELARAAA